MRILITGATNGMGKGLAQVLAGLHNNTHEIIILCRSLALGNETVRELEQLTGNKSISLIICDLSSMNDVKQAIVEIQNKNQFLDCIFINAGLGYAEKRIETVDGFDSHFQVNYLSQFMLTLNLLNLLEQSESGGRVIFNITKGGNIFWDDLQLNKSWSFERAIGQSMLAKRMFLLALHNYYSKSQGSKISFVGFEISKTVWSNQVNIIPLPMKIMASIMKLFGTFISIEECGIIMTPLFTESQNESLAKSGKLITWKKSKFIDLIDDASAFNNELLEKLWNISLKLCDDEKTIQIAEKLKSE